MTRFQLVFRRDGEHDRSEYRYNDGDGEHDIDGRLTHRRGDIRHP